MAKGKRGRPKWEITPQILAKVEDLASHGMTEEQIALALGVCYSTIQRRKAESEDFSAAVKRGKAKGIELVTGILYEKIRDKDNFALAMYLNNIAGWRQNNRTELDVRFATQEQRDAAVNAAIEADR